MGELRAMVIDWGGVLTQPMRDTVRAWIAADKIDWERYVAVVGPWLTDAYASNGNGDGVLNPVHALERGECTVAEFEALLAGLLVRTDGGPVLADGLLTRMLSAVRPVPARGLPAPVRRRGDLRRGWHAQARAAYLPARRRAARPRTGTLRIRRRPRGQRHGRGRLRDDRGSPHRTRAYPTAADGVVCQSLGFACMKGGDPPSPPLGFARGGEAIPIASQS